MTAALTLPSIALGWLFLGQVAMLLLWYRAGTQRRNGFASRLDELLVLLLSQRTTTAEENHPQGVVQTLHRLSALSGLRGRARRWGQPLDAIRAQGEQIASELVSPGAHAVDGARLVEESVTALAAERAARGARVPAVADPVVLIAYGLGSWPPGADLTSLEQLLSELGTSQRQLRNRFDSVIDTPVPASQSRPFAELAAASFLLGASAHIVQVANRPDNDSPAAGMEHHTGHVPLNRQAQP